MHSTPSIMLMLNSLQGILTSLKNRAFQIYSQFRSGNTPVMLPSSVGSDYGEDELALFGGQTRVLLSKIMVKRGINRKPYPPSNNGVSSPASTDFSNTTASTPLEHPKDSPSPSDSLDVHPSLVEYLSLLPPSQHPSYSPPHEFHKPSFPEPLSTYGMPNEEVYYGQLHYPTSNLPSASQFGVANGTSSFFNDFSEPSAFGPSTYQPPNSTPDPKLLDFGMMMTGDSGMDEHWKSFMRESGLILDKPTPYTSTSPT